MNLLMHVLSIISVFSVSIFFSHALYLNASSQHFHPQLTITRNGVSVDTVVLFSNAHCKLTAKSTVLKNSLVKAETRYVVSPANSNPASASPDCTTILTFIDTGFIDVLCIIYFTNGDSCTISKTVYCSNPVHPEAIFFEDTLHLYTNKLQYADEYVWIFDDGLQVFSVSNEVVIHLKRTPSLNGIVYVKFQTYNSPDAPFSCIFFPTVDLDKYTQSNTLEFNSYARN